MADLEGLEPPTPWFEAKCSIHLSYRSTILPVTVAPVSTAKNYGLANAGFAFVQRGVASYFPSPTTKHSLPDWPVAGRLQFSRVSKWNLLGTPGQIFQPSTSFPSKFGVPLTVGIGTRQIG